MSPQYLRAPVLSLLACLLSPLAWTAPTLLVSTEKVPAGGTAQFKISLSAPARITSGRIVMDFDPSVFGDIQSVAVFGANADSYGASTIVNRHLDAQFNSRTGGIGRLPDIPILTVVIPVLPAATTGATRTIVFNTGGSAWKDLQNADFPVSAGTGQLIVGGSLSIQNVVPGGGLLPAGSKIEIDGSGFSALTILDVQGVSVSSMEVLDSSRITFTLPTPTELEGKRIVLRNPDGSQIDYICAFKSVPVEPPNSLSLAGIQPLFTPVSFAAAAFSYGESYALGNQNPFPVIVTFVGTTARSNLGGEQKVTIPAGGLLIQQAPPLGGLGGLIVPSAPIRMLILSLLGSPVRAFLPVPLPVPQFGLDVSNSPVSFEYQVGTPAPSPAGILVCSANYTDFNATVSTVSGGAWLSAPAHGKTTPCNPPNLEISVDPTGLSPGTYTGSVTVTGAGDFALPIVIPVSLRVSTQALISTDPIQIRFDVPPSGPAPAPQSLTILSNGSPAPFSATAITVSGGNWLSVTPSSGSTTLTLTVSANITGLSPGSYIGQITITGPLNTRIVPVNLSIQAATVPPTRIPPLVGSPSSLMFSIKSGTVSGSKTVRVSSTNFSPVYATATASTDSGGPWLVVTQGNVLGGAIPYEVDFNVSVNSQGLANGTYHGKITLLLLNEPAGEVPVTLVVWTTPPPLVVTPSSLFFSNDQNGAIPDQTLDITSGGVPVQIEVSSTLFNVTCCVDQFTPAQVFVSVQGYAPGAYSGNITISSPAGNVVVPVTAMITAPVSNQLAGPPLLGAVANSASQERRGVAPGEIITIYGSGIGPESGAGLSLSADGNVVSTLYTTQVLFDGHPAPLLYVSQTQVNTIVPYEVAGQSSTNIQVAFNGQRTDLWGVPVVPAAPAISTLDSSGRGGAAVLNQDNTVNTPSNPAKRGSVVQIFATGEGVTLPASATGSVTDGSLKMPVAPVHLTIGGVEAEVLYAGSAPESVAGLLQVNARVPAIGNSGPAVPILLSIGQALSQSGATITIQ